jgi:hypothetical protein
MSIKGMIKRAARASGRKVMLTRFRTGTFRDGVFHAEVLFRREITASVQPMDENKIQVTPDNLTRLRSMVQVYSVEPLLAADKAIGQKADELEIDGEVYTVDSPSNWKHRTLQHYESVAIRKGTQ